MRRTVCRLVTGLLAPLVVASTARADALDEVPTDSAVVLHVGRLSAAGPLGAAMLRPLGVTVEAADPVAAVARGLGVPPTLLDGFKDVAVSVAADGDDGAAVLLVPYADYEGLAAALAAGGRWRVAQRGLYAAVSRRADRLGADHAGLPVDAFTAAEVTFAAAAPAAAAVWVNLPGAHGIVTLLAPDDTAPARPTTRPVTTRPDLPPFTSADRAFTAVDAFLGRIGRNPGPAVLHERLGLLLSRTGHPAAAGGQFHRAIRLDPVDPTPHVNLATTLVQTSQPLAALRELQAAIGIDPANYDAYHNAGIVLAQLQQFDRAARMLAEAARLRPQWPEVRNDLGVVLSRLGQYRLAAVELSIALRLRPNYPEAQRNLDIVRRLAAEQARVAATGPTTGPATTPSPMPSPAGP